MRTRYARTDELRDSATALRSEDLVESGVAVLRHRAPEHAVVEERGIDLRLARGPVELDMRGAAAEEVAAVSGYSGRRYPVPGSPPARMLPRRQSTRRDRPEAPPRGVKRPPLTEEEPCRATSVPMKMWLALAGSIAIAPTERPLPPGSATGCARRDRACCRQRATSSCRRRSTCRDRRRPRSHSIRSARPCPRRASSRSRRSGRRRSSRSRSTGCRCPTDASSAAGQAHCRPARRRRPRPR